MYKFNNTEIITGYIKQLLSSFNLPKYKVYTMEDAKYFLENNKENIDIIPSGRTGTADNADTNITYVHYIRNGYIMHYINGEWKQCDNKVFNYNTPVLNWTKTLQIKNNIYDTYTHEYLGDYLRFLRDYNQIDLMSMYNCFSNKICCNVDFTTSNSKYNKDDTRQYAVNGFKSASDSFKIYMLPVKMFKNYTIAIDSNMPIEICCGLYNKYQDTNERLFELPNKTYQKINKINFSQPILYTKLYDYCCELSSDVKNKNLVKLQELAQNERELKLFIKIPASINSSIVILEGDYRTWNNKEFVKNKTIYNNTITNFAYIDKIAEFDTIKLISPCQLLNFNSGISYPYADRLIEYLTGNAITTDDLIMDNVARVQKIMHNNDAAIEIDGLFSNRMKHELYDYAVAHKDNSAFSTDYTGYVDKDIENIYVDDNNNSIMNAEWEDE